MTNGSGVTPAEARSELGRMVESQALQEAETLRRLLLYLGEATLEGKAEHLKEYTVGVECLGRPSHYDPRTDSSARMLAARLRRKIEDYYRGEGAADAVRIGFPKGSFKLTFETVSVAPAGPGREAGNWKIVAVACLCATLILVPAAFLTARRGKAPAPAGWTADLEALWQPLLDDAAPILISFGSPLFVAQEGLNVRNADVNEWSDLAGSADLKRVAPLLPLSHWKPNFDYAGIGDVHGVFLVSKLLAARKPQLVLKRGIVLSWEDIKNNHLVFIGNGKNQEKLREVLTGRDFVLEGSSVRNVRPRAGEPAEFRETGDPKTGELRVAYAVLTFLPGLEQGRYMFLLSAQSTETIWGAVESVTNPKFAAPLVARLRTGGSLPKAFQLVVKIKLNAGVPVEAGYETHHVL